MPPNMKHIILANVNLQGSAATDFRGGGSFNSNFLHRCFMDLAERVGTTTEQQLYRPSTMTRSYSVQYSCWLQLINYHKNTSSRLLELNDCWLDLRNCVLVKYNCVHTDMTAHTAQHCYDGDAAVLWGTTIPLLFVFFFFQLPEANSPASLRANFLEIFHTMPNKVYSALLNVVHKRKEEQKHYATFRNKSNVCSCGVTHQRSEL